MAQIRGASPLQCIHLYEFHCLSMATYILCKNLGVDYFHVFQHFNLIRSNYFMNSMLFMAEKGKFERAKTEAFDQRIILFSTLKMKCRWFSWKSFFLYTFFSFEINFKNSFLQLIFQRYLTLFRECSFIRLLMAFVFFW